MTVSKFYLTKHIVVWNYQSLIKFWWILLLIGWFPPTSIKFEWKNRWSSIPSKFLIKVCQKKKKVCQRNMRHTKVYHAVFVWCVLITFMLFQGHYNFLSEYKNPCFNENRIVIQNKSKIHLRVFRCVPYFFIIGMPKCGTSDLWISLTFHADVKIDHFKEPMWFNRKRFCKYMQ